VAEFDANFSDNLSEYEQDHWGFALTKADVWLRAYEVVQKKYATPDGLRTIGSLSDSVRAQLSAYKDAYGKAPGFHYTQFAKDLAAIEDAISHVLGIYIRDMKIDPGTMQAVCREEFRGKFCVCRFASDPRYSKTECRSELPEVVEALGRTGEILVTPEILERISVSNQATARPRKQRKLFADLFAMDIFIGVVVIVIAVWGLIAFIRNLT